MQVVLTESGQRPNSVPEFETSFQQDGSEHTVAHHSKPILYFTGKRQHIDLLPTEDGHSFGSSFSVSLISQLKILREDSDETDNDEE